VAHSIPLKLGDRIYFGCWDCHLYCINTQGKLVWKFHTSLSHMSKVSLPPPKSTSVQFTVILPGEKEEEKKYRPEERDIADYGSFSGKYVDITKSDYLGRRKKGYL